MTHVGRENGNSVHRGIQSHPPNDTSGSPALSGLTGLTPPDVSGHSGGKAPFSGKEEQNWEAGGGEKKGRERGSLGSYAWAY